MKNKLILRKDIEMSLNRYGRMMTITSLEIYKHNKNPYRLDILEALTRNELFLLEERFIEEGLFFEWIEDGKTVIGILLLENDLTENDDIIRPFKKYTPDVVIDNINETKKHYIEKRKEN